ncbi:MAG: GNAT family N-acetyltransferase [Promethearchaeota archaeon]
MLFFLFIKLKRRLLVFIRGTYDGSRAIIHQLSIHPEYQKRNIGQALVNKIIKKFKERGSDTVLATVNDESFGFWKKVGFRKVNVFLVGNW